MIGVIFGSNRFGYNINSHYVAGAGGAHASALSWHRSFVTSTTYGWISLLAGTRVVEGGMGEKGGREGGEEQKIPIR